MTIALNIETELTEAAWALIERHSYQADEIIGALNNGCDVYLDLNGFIAASPVKSVGYILAQNYESKSLVMISVDTGYVFTRQAIINAYAPAA